MSFLEHVNVETHKSIVAKILAMNWLKGAGTVFLSVYATIFHDHKVLVAVYTLICIDTILGVASACKHGQVSSSAFFRVLIKSVLYFLMIMTGRLVDSVVPVAFASSIVESFLAMTEALSILENVAKLGMPIPMKLIRILKQVGDQKSETLPEKKS